MRQRQETKSQVFRISLDRKTAKDSSSRTRQLKGTDEKKLKRGLLTSTEPYKQETAATPERLQFKRCHPRLTAWLQGALLG